jgi:XTP/dITP diphosphohydrolase
MNAVAHPQRKAQFRCVLAFTARPGSERIVEGICAGTIIETPRGTQGFGYDPLFVPTGYDQTFAEMSMDLKNTLSHRAKALIQMKSVLLDYFNFPDNQS